MYVAPIITGHGSLPFLFSHLRESSSFFNFFCEFVSTLIHNSYAQIFISIIIFCFALRFAIRLLTSYSSRFSAYLKGDSNGGFFETILDFFFEITEDEKED